MGYLQELGSNLIFSAGRASKDLISHFGYRYIKDADGNLLYRGPNEGSEPLRFRNAVTYYSGSAALHMLAQTAVQAADAELKRIIPRYKRKILEKNVTDSYRAERKEKIELIKNEVKKVDGNLGKIYYGKGKNDFFCARDCYGHAVSDALGLSYKSDRKRVFTQVEYDVDTKKMGTKSVETDLVCFFDVTPHISQSSSKNIILTKVQGRDYTRKEIISGGDSVFTVHGEINSNMMGVYPDYEVQKFIEIMQYGGIIDVTHRIFSEFNIKHVIIQSFNLGDQQYKNIQPYSFTCVGIEPDEEVQVVTDTIHFIDQTIASSELSTWNKLVLGYKFSDITSAGEKEWAKKAAIEGFDDITRLPETIIKNFLPL